MKQINITEFRQHLSSYLSSVQKGAEIMITSHGRVIAHIVPPADPQKKAQERLHALRQHAFVGDVTSSIDEK